MVDTSLRFINTRFYCHTCNKAFNEMVNPDHYEQVRCPTCKNDFLEQIERKAERPADLPAPQPASEPREEGKMEEGKQESPRREPQQRQQRQHSRRLASTNIAFSFNGPTGQIIYEYTTSPTEVQQSQEGLMSGPSLSFLFPFAGMHFEENFASHPRHRFGMHPINFFDLASLIAMAENGNSTHPTAKEALKKLPVVQIEEKHCKKAGDKLETPTCAVCCSNLNMGDQGQILPCGHLFHPGCISPWLKEHNTCPVCRHELPTEDGEELRMGVEY